MCCAAMKAEAATLSRPALAPSACATRMPYTAISQISRPLYKKCSLYSGMRMPAVPVVEARGEAAARPVSGGSFHRLHPHHPGLFGLQLDRAFDRHDSIDGFIRGGLSPAPVPGALFPGRWPQHPAGGAQPGGGSPVSADCLARPHLSAQISRGCVCREWRMDVLVHAGRVAGLGWSAVGHQARSQTRIKHEKAETRTLSFPEIMRILLAQTVKWPNSLFVEGASLNEPVRLVASLLPAASAFVSCCIPVQHS